MKTRIEFGSGYVQIICSRTLAAAIGAALEVAFENDADQEHTPIDIDYIWRIAQALNRADNFEEEEPV